MSKQKHLSRLAAPKTWPIQRKGMKWVAKPAPGPHSIQRSMPLQLYLTDILKLVKTKAEVNKILSQGLVIINGKVRKDVRFPVGLFDTIRVSKYNKSYRVLLDKKNHLKLAEIPDSEANLIVARVEGKTTIKGGKIQVNLSNGRTFIADKDYKVGDSILFDVNQNKPTKHIKLEKGGSAYIIGGGHAGSVVEVFDFKEEGILRKKKYIVAKTDAERLNIPLKEVFMVGKDKAEITIP